MSRLSREHGALNLGQGFPERDRSERVKRAISDAIFAASNQYAPMRGNLGLREALAEHYQTAYGRIFDPERQVLITSGATEAIACSLLAHLGLGDRVLVIEPAYDAYLPWIRRIGAEPCPVRLDLTTGRLNLEDLGRAAHGRLALFILNTPSNPGSRLLHPDDVNDLARLVMRDDSVVVLDEVWEKISYGAEPFASLSTYPGLGERSIKIGSAGKWFGLTGIKVGFVVGAQGLLDPMSEVHQYLTFSTTPHLQRGLAEVLREPQLTGFFAQEIAELSVSRHLLEGLLGEAGFACLPCEGTYFLTVDLLASGLNLADMEFAKRAVKEFGVSTIPLPPFYSDHPETRYLRLRFAKEKNTLHEAAGRLARARAALL